MIALMRKDVMTSGVKIKYLFLAIVGIYLLFLFTPIDDLLIPNVAYILMIFAPIIYFSSIYNYTDADNYKSEMILPIKTYKIVLSRYMTYLFLLTICFISMLGLLFYKSISGEELFQEAIMNVINLGVGVALIFGGLVLLFAFIFGQEKIQTIGITAFILTLVPVRLFMELGAQILSLNNVFDIYNNTKIMSFFLLFSTIFYVCSSGLSIMIFKRKQF